MPHFFRFTFLFIVLIVFACVVSALSIGPNIAGISHVLVALICAFPFTIGLFIIVNRRFKHRPILRMLLPLSIFPLLFSLLVGYTLLYERNPRHMFQVFVANPMPIGVTEIQARDISAGFSEDVVVLFKAPAGVAETIISQKGLEKVANPDKGKHNFPGRYFPGESYIWGPNWLYYQRVVTRDGSSNGSLDYVIRMWVDPTQSIVIYRMTR